MSKTDSVTVSIEKNLYADISKDAEQVGNNVKHNVEPYCRSVRQSPNTLKLCTKVKSTNKEMILAII